MKVVLKFVSLVLVFATLIFLFVIVFFINFKYEEHDRIRLKWFEIKKLVCLTMILKIILILNVLYVGLE
jgi:hypothetical protein